MQHPALARLHGDVHTRIGISPNNRSFRVGVLRTHLLTALLGHAVAEHLGTTAYIHLRCDDTDSQRADMTNLPELLEEVGHVADIATAPVLLHQSERGDRYQTAVEQLNRLGVLDWAVGMPYLNLDAADRVVPPVSGTAVVVNMSLSNHRPRNRVPLTRSDGTALWHLASVVDDVDLGINLIVRGTDKIDAVGIQHRLWQLLGGGQPVAYMFVPKLRDANVTPVRVVDLTSALIRPSAIRWYLTEPYLTEGRPPQNFQHLVERLRPTLPVPRDSSFDLARLAAFDRKMSAVLGPAAGARELMRIVGTEHRGLVDRVCAEHRRPLTDQVAAYRSLTQQRVPPQHAAGSTSEPGPVLPATRTTAAPPTGR
ncbi:hypothetical protein ACQEVZ_27985 [Dactylosporangium sp. CA-152071]|uniref:hypothetical protein n=1 Tax=Dactylosporangium sp. CA-152071 TaxID=3239933 RepID=UPI003D8B7636